MKTTNSTNTNESSVLNSGNGNIINHRASPFIVEDTSSSISSFQSTSDQSSLAGSLVESPTKTEPIESFATSSVNNIPNYELNPNMNTTETVTMTLEEISQFAQNIYWFAICSILVTYDGLFIIIIFHLYKNEPPKHFLLLFQKIYVPSSALLFFCCCRHFEWLYNMKKKKTQQNIIMKMVIATKCTNLFLASK